MKMQIMILAGGLSLAALSVWTVPSTSANTKMQEAESAARSLVRPELDSALAGVDAEIDAELSRAQEGLDELAQKIHVVKSFDDGASWLGVETAEVTADKVKELKLGAERGAVLTQILPDSPAAKAGLKAGDVVTEFNGQHVEGAAQFRRFIHETPAGRSVQLTIWRDGNAQTILAVLGKAEQRHQMRSLDDEAGATFFHGPRMPRIEIPRFELNGDSVFLRRPLLGIVGDNLNGQLGSYFGAPDGEGVLVREVTSGSPAEKAGLKAGDVLTKVDGDRVRTLSDLREKLVQKLGDKDEKKTVSVVLLREHKEKTVNVEVERPQMPKVRQLTSHRRTI